MNIDFMQSLLASYIARNDSETYLRIYSELQKEIFAKGFENQYLHNSVNAIMLLTDNIQDPQ